MAVMAASATAETTCENPIEEGDRVKVHYIATRSDDGSTWDENQGNPPFMFIVGETSVLDDFSNAMIGACAGSEKIITVTKEAIDAAGVSGRSKHGNKVPLGTEITFTVSILDVLPKSAVSAVSDLWKALRGRSNVTEEEVLKALDLGMDPNDPDVDGRTPLCTASFTGNFDAARLLLNRGADANAKLKTGLTSLMYASGEGHVDIMRELLAHGATVNDALKPGSPLGGYTALHFAALQGRAESVRILIENGADPSIVANDGSTALDVARRFVTGGKHKGARKADRERSKQAFAEIQKLLQDGMAGRKDL